MTKKRVSILEIAEQFGLHMANDHVGEVGVDVPMDELRHILTETQLNFLARMFYVAFLQGGVFCATHPQSVKAFKGVDDFAKREIGEYEN